MTRRLTHLRFLTLMSLAGTSFLLSCGRAETARLLDDEATQKTYWQELAPVCAGYPSKVGCDDGDMVLFGGLLCASGDSRGCDLVRQAQGRDGQWWRSPRRNPGNLGQDSSFSRDMAMGVLLYLETTRDTAAAQAWLGWIEANRACVWRGFGDHCLLRGPHRFCRDDHNQSCTLTPGNWSLLGRVWHHLGLPLTQEMRAFAETDSDALVVQASTAEVGYPLHLLATEAWLKQRLHADASKRAQAAEILAERQPDNPLFVYLAKGASAPLKAKLIQLCPRPGGPASARSQWSWERDTADQAWHDSMGWDCLFLGRVLASEL